MIMRETHSIVLLLLTPLSKPTLSFQCLMDPKKLTSWKGMYMFDF